MFMPLIQKRRSIRKYQRREVPPEKIDPLVEAVLRSPSSMGNNPWEFIVVTDPAMLEKLSAAKPHGATFLKNAPLGIVVLGDPGKSRVWIEDCAIASIYIHIAAQGMGLGSCWIQIRARMHDEARSAGDYVADMLGIPSHMEVEAIVAVGFPDKEKPPHPKTSLQYEKVFRGRYGTPYGA